MAMYEKVTEEEKKRGKMAGGAEQDVGGRLG